MYKTVRQGDASLQYTILPQIDEFYAHDVTSVRGSPTVKGHHCTTEDRFWLPSSRMLCFMLMSLMIIIIITCCVMATYVINAMIRGSCVATTSRPVSTVTNRLMITNDGNDDENNESTDSMTTTSSNPFHESTMSVLTSKSSTSYSTTNDDEDTTDFEFTIEETTTPTTEEARSTTHSSGTGSTSTSTLSSLEPDAVSSDSRASIIEAPIKNILNILKKLKILTMPRVKLKLRINDPIPQMYMKTGIASYKKGKIITSVLAQGLSLEEFIFKTPDGTIKPWRGNWPFDDDSDISQRKRMFRRDIIGVTMILLILGLSIMAFRSLKVTGKRLHSIEDAEVESQDETQSILLDSQSQDNEDKE